MPDPVAQDTEVLSVEFFCRSTTDGSAQILIQLMTELNVTSRRVDVLDVALPNLHLDLLPTRYEPSISRGVSYRAGRSIMILAVVVQALHMKTPADRIMPFVDGICAWVRYLTIWPAMLRPRGGPTIDRVSIEYLTLLGLLSDCGIPPLRAAVVTCPAFVGLVATCWMSREEDGKFVIWMSPDASHAYPLALVARMVGDEDGAQAFGDWLANSSFSTATIVDSVIQRCHQIRTNEESYPSAGVLGCINNLLHVAKYLVLNNSEARRRLLKAGLIRYCMAALEEHSRDPQVVKAANFHLPLFSAVETLRDIARQTESTSGLSQLAGGATIVLILRLLDSIPGGEAFHNHRKFLLNLATWVARYFLRPDASLEGMPKRDETKQSLTSIPEIEDLFDMIEAAQERSERIFRPCLNACDNPSCTRPVSILSPSSRSKKCALCSSMMYCSRACQERDWNERHRTECPQAKAAEFGACFRSFQSYRVNSVAQLMTQYARKASQVEEQRSQQFPELSLRDVVIVIYPPWKADGRGWSFEIMPRNSWFKVVTQYSPAKYLGARVASLLEELDAGHANSSSLQLIGGVFKLEDDLYALVTVKAQYSGEHLASPVYSIVQNGTSECVEKLRVGEARGWLQG